MRILIVGILAFITWSAFSVHYYVCNIKHLCTENDSEPMETIYINPELVDDTLKNNQLKKMEEIPGVLTVNFEYDKSEFNPDAATGDFAERSKSYIHQNATARISITGHTDAKGSDDYNQALGLRRANSLLRYFKQKGMGDEKMVVTSKGEKDPVDNNNTIAGRANNRRTVVTIN